MAFLSRCWTGDFVPADSSSGNRTRARCFGHTLPLFPPFVTTARRGQELEPCWYYRDIEMKAS